MLPLVAVFRNTDTVLVPLFENNKSDLPSASKSPIAMEKGPLVA